MLLLTFQTRDKLHIQVMSWEANNPNGPQLDEIHSLHAQPLIPFTSKGSVKEAMPPWILWE